MDRYNTEGEQRFLESSRRFYAQAFEGAPDDFYVGINAAAKSLMLGEKDEAAEYARRVAKILEQTASTEDY